MKKDIVIQYEHVAFNASWAASKTEAEFIKHEGHHNLPVEQLKEAYKLCKDAVNPSIAENKATAQQ